jgi:pre-mRNA-splicing factor CWC26
MKDYLKRYQSGPAAADQKKAKKKKNKPNAPAGAGVLIVDEDPVWQKPVQIEEDEPASSGLDLRNPSRSRNIIS